MAIAIIAVRLREPDFMLPFNAAGLHRLTINYFTMFVKYNNKKSDMKLMTSKYAEPSVSIALLLLRVVAGSSMLMNHGLKKISNFNAILSKGFADPFHIGTKASLSLTIFAEVFCAGLLVIGLLTRLASLPLIIAMVVALFFAHGGQLFGEGESAGLFLTMFIVIFLMGPGKFSLDKKIGK